MGIMQHKALIVTGLQSTGDARVKKARTKALKLFPKESVSKLCGMGINGYTSFFIAPCGSKVGWNPDVEHEESLGNFIEYLESLKYEDGSTCVKYVYVTFGELGLTVQDYMGNEFFAESK